MNSGSSSTTSPLGVIRRTGTAPYKNHTCSHHQLPHTCSLIHSNHCSFMTTGSASSPPSARQTLQICTGMSKQTNLGRSSHRVPSTRKLVRHLHGDFSARRSRAGNSAVDSRNCRCLLQDGAVRENSTKEGSVPGIPNRSSTQHFCRQHSITCTASSERLSYFQVFTSKYGVFHFQAASK